MRPALALLLLCSALPAAAQLDGSLALTSQSDGERSVATSASLEFGAQAGAASVSGRASGVYKKTPGGGRMFETSEAVLEAKTPHAELYAGDISPAFSDYTLSAPSLEEGAELNLKAAGFSLRPVYLRLAEADPAAAVYERRLYGASLTKENLPGGFSLGVAGYRASDDEASLAAGLDKRPQEITTVGLKAGFRAASALNAFYEFSASRADRDASDARGGGEDQAFKGGFTLNWDRWSLGSRYSRCGRDYQAAGVDTVDNDQGKLAVDAGYSFSDHISARISETRVTDGLSRGRDSRVDKQTSLFSASASFPGLPSLSADYSASRNRNRLLLVNDEAEDLGYSLSWAPRALPGLAVTAGGRFGKSRDHTLQADPSKTVSQNYAVSLPFKLLAAFTLSPTFNRTASENKRTRARTYSETAAAALTASAFSGKVSLNLSGSRAHSYDNTGASDTRTTAGSAQLSLAPAAAVRVTLGASTSSAEDEVNPAASAVTRQYTLAATVNF